MSKAPGPTGEETRRLSSVGEPPYASSAFFIAARRLCKNKTAVIGLVVFLLICLACLLAPYLTKWNYYTLNSKTMRLRPSLEHLFGTDSMGRDVLTRMLYGGRITLRIAVLAASMAAVAGSVLGVISGYAGKRADKLVTAVLDVLDSIPIVVLALVSEAVLGWGRGNFMYAIAIAATPKFAQLVRGSVLNITGSAYIEASRALGISHFGIIFRHILRNVAPPLIVRYTISVTETMLTCTIMGYLSVGITPPTPEWGAIVHEVRGYVLTNPIMTILPCLVVSITLISFSLFGDGVRDALDPHE